MIGWVWQLDYTRVWYTGLKTCYSICESSCYELKMLLYKVAMEYLLSALE